MTADQVLTALQLPDGCRVGQRVAKKLLAEHGAPTAADKRRINEGVEEVNWVATLKPTTIGVPPFRDDVREYLEISVVSASLRDGADVTRIMELIHRAIPYPVVLVATTAGKAELSLAHKRASQSLAEAIVLDGTVVTVSCGSEGHNSFDTQFLESLSLSRQPQTNIHVLYEGWMNAVLALQAAHLTGIFAESTSPERRSIRKAALIECSRLDREIARLRAEAEHERQLSRRVTLNMQLKRAEQQRFTASADL